MKTAVIADGTVVWAQADAPPVARCAACGQVVMLRRSGPHWYYRHQIQVRDCRRCKPPRERAETRPAAQTANNDNPYVAMAMDSVGQAIRRARSGNLAALLSLAFSPVVRLTLDVVGLSPEEVLDIVAAGQRRERSPLVWVTEDEGMVLKKVLGAPGPIFDVRNWHDGHIAALEALPWYVPLRPVGPATAALVRRIAALSRQVYVLGSVEEWEAAWKGTNDLDSPSRLWEGQR